MSVERQVAEHYGISDLIGRVRAGLTAAGLDPDRLDPEDLAPVDEFHIGGRAATVHFAGMLDFKAGSRLLDVGSGLGGASRFFALQSQCHVTGIDLTPEYVEAARQLSAMTGMSEATAFETASALALPFGDQAFDGAFTIHVAMNIADRAALYGEVARVLKPGATFGIYDVMKGPAEGLDYPVPWAEEAATSHLTAPDELRGLLQGAGFEVLAFEDRSEFGLEFFKTLQARAAAGGPPPLGLHLLMGESAGQKVANMRANLEAGRILPAVMTARRR